MPSPNRTVLATALVAALAACSGGPATPEARTPGAAAMPDRISSAPRSDAGATRLTVYSGDFDAVSNSYPGNGMPGLALVSQTIRREVGQGDGEITVGGLPRALDAGGVRLTPADTGVTVRGQRYEFALAGQDEHLQRAIGRPIEVAYSTGGARQTERGVLLAAGSGLTLRLDDGRIRVLSAFDSFDLTDLPGGLNAEPTLRWQVAATDAGEHVFQLDYPTGGLAWRAEYHIGLEQDGAACRMRFSGSAQVANRSGAGFEAAQLTLVAGDPNTASKIQPRQERAMMMSAPAAPAAQADMAPTPRDSGEYHAYTLPSPADVPDGSVQQVPLLEAADAVACQRVYETRNGITGYVPPRPLVRREIGPAQTEAAVTASLHFTNDEASGLGMPLPAGRARMFDGDDYLGEAMLAHTPAGREVELAIGNVFDLSAQRTREDFQLDAGGRTLTERYAITLHNAKSAPATVRVVEGLPRWSEWEIVDAGGGDWQPEDAQSVATEVEVPAGGEATVRYTVRYRWAADMRTQ
uniref:DUF4139 domain-containing protein n=1 Tax=Coralloluteibacterium stylophorae TaxID=1776034 RepID=A0A8J7VYF3_9GAMM